MKLSIITLSLPSRVERFLPRISAQMKVQTAGKPVEWICVLDNQTISVGRKWNIGIDGSSGKYITVIGDDDLVSDDYVDRLLEAIDANEGVDCIVFNSAYYCDNEFLATCHWGLEYEYRDDWDHKQMWRYPGEMMAIRRDIRLAHPYEDVWRGSDWRQSKAMRPALKSQHRIMGEGGQTATLYHMYNRSDNDEHIRAQKAADDEQRKQERRKLRSKLRKEIIT